MGKREANASSYIFGSRTVMRQLARKDGGEISLRPGELIVPFIVNARARRKIGDHVQI